MTRTDRKHVEDTSTSSSPGKSAERDSSLSPALQKECAKLEKLIASAERSDLKRRFEIAFIVQRIKNGGTRFGEKPLEKLEDLFGFDRKTMYRWAHVIDVWSTKKALSELLSKTMGNGLPLTWSHLELLAELGGRRRDAFLKRVLDESLSVRKLREAIEHARSDSDKTAGDLPDTAPPPTTRFEQLLTSLDHAADVAGGWREAVKELSTQPPSPQVVASLEHAREVGKRIRDLGADMQTLVDAELKRLRPPMPAVVSAPTVTRVTTNAGLSA